MWFTKKGCISENDIIVLSTKLPKLRNLILLRRKQYFYHAKIQVIAPNGLVNGWSVNFDLRDQYNSLPWATTDEKFERLIVNWQSISRVYIVSDLLTDRSIKLLSETNGGLKKFQLRMDNLTGNSLDYLGLHCKNLNSVDLNINENITESSIKNLLHLKNIKTFRLWEEDRNVFHWPPGISEGGMKRILPLLRDVEDFCLFSEHLVTDYVIESLANNCQRIQDLTLIEGQLTGSGLRRILKATGSSLKYLNLEWCDNLTSNDMISIPNFCASLEELDLGLLEDEIGRRKYSRKCLDYLQSKITKVTFNDDDVEIDSENSSDA